jgi:hypothetical protein
MDSAMALGLATQKNSEYREVKGGERERLFGQQVNYAGFLLFPLADFHRIRPRPRPFDILPLQNVLLPALQILCIQCSKIWVRCAKICCECKRIWGHL